MLKQIELKIQGPGFRGHIQRQSQQSPRGAAPSLPPLKLPAFPRHWLVILQTHRFGTPPTDLSSYRPSSQTCGDTSSLYAWPTWSLTAFPGNLTKPANYKSLSNPTVKYAEPTGYCYPYKHDPLDQYSLLTQAQNTVCTCQSSHYHKSTDSWQK